MDEAINEVDSILRSTGVESVVNKVNVANEELAIKFRLLSFPTIRINGRDIQLEVLESYYQTCSDLSGEATDCKIWVYKGKEYNVPPKAMIIEVILTEIYGGNDSYNTPEQEYVISDNLIQFYFAMG